MNLLHFDLPLPEHGDVGTSYKIFVFVSSTSSYYLLQNLAKKREELETAPPNGLEPKGTVAGAVALIIGTVIGSGILALPKKTSPAVLLSFLKTIVLVNIRHFNSTNGSWVTRLDSVFCDHICRVLYPVHFPWSFAGGFFWLKLSC